MESVRAIRIPAELLLPVIGHEHVSEMKFYGHSVDLNKQTFKVFQQKGVKCKLCGIEGTHFIIHKPNKGGGWQLTLVAFHPLKGMMFMNADHIIPRDAGGPNTLDNLQPMCAHCNGGKANFLGITTYAELQERLAVERKGKLSRNERKKLRSFVRKYVRPGILSPRPRQRLLLTYPDMA